MFIILAEGGGLLETAAEIGKTFGWKPAYFIAQVINFVLVLFVLKKFAFGPIQEILEARKNRIAEGEEKLVAIEAKLADSEKTNAVLIEKANDDAKRLIAEAKEGAATLSEQKAQEATTQAQSIISKAQEAAATERTQMAAELKQEFGRLVVATTSQVSGKVLTDDDQARINQEALASVQN